MYLKHETDDDYPEEDLDYEAFSLYENETPSGNHSLVSKPPAKHSLMYAAVINTIHDPTINTVSHIQSLESAFKLFITPIL